MFMTSVMYGPGVALYFTSLLMVVEMVSRLNDGVMWGPDCNHTALHSILHQNLLSSSPVRSKLTCALDIVEIDLWYVKLVVVKYIFSMNKMKI